MENIGSTHEILEPKGKKCVYRIFTALIAFIKKKSKNSKTKNILLKREASKTPQEENSCRSK